MKCNYHTHTKRCHHATSEDEEYVIAAIKNGYDVLGFSDHAPWNYKSDYKPRIRMAWDEFDEYYQSIKTLKIKYQDKIKILIGLEAEYYPEYIDELRRLKDKYQLDYLVFGNHFYQSDEINMYFGSITKDDKYMDEYLRYFKEGSKTGLYKYFCHPDLFMRGRHVFDDKAKELSYAICKYAKENDIILEYNLEGLKDNMTGRMVYYPHIEFWKIVAEIGNKVIIGVDAHNPKSLESDYYRNIALKELSKLNIKPIDYLEI